MLINPCNLKLNTSNTGIECQSALSVTAMFIWGPISARFTDADITTAGSFTDLVREKSHAASASRWFPMFGFAAPIISITENNESDVVETLDNGSSVFVRYGMYNRTILTNKGGLCFAAHLMNFPDQYGFLEVDQQGKVQVYQVSPGVYSFIPVNMVKGLGPTLATFSTVYKNRLMISFDPTAYVLQGKIFASDSTENILGSKGLIDTEVLTGAQTQTTTNIFVKVETECAETDLIALYPTELADPDNFVVTNKATGVVVTISAATVVAGEMRLTGTFVSGQTYIVALAAPAVLLAADIEYYDGVVSAEVLIP